VVGALRLRGPLASVSLCSDGGPLHRQEAQEACALRRAPVPRVLRQGPAAQHPPAEGHHARGPHPDPGRGPRAAFAAQDPPAGRWLVTAAPAALPQPQPLGWLAYAHVSTTTRQTIAGERLREGMCCFFCWFVCAKQLNGDVIPIAEHCVYVYEMPSPPYSHGIGPIHISGMLTSAY